MRIKNIKEKLGRATLEQLNALRVFTLYSPPVVTIKTVSDCTSTADTSLGGVISSLSRLNVDGKSLIVPAGRDREEGMRWRLNEEVISREDLATQLESVLGKDFKWAKSPKLTI